MIPKHQNKDFTIQMRKHANYEMMILPFQMEDALIQNEKFTLQIDDPTISFTIQIDELTLRNGDSINSDRRFYNPH